ncbi:MAG: hypothetical protein IKR81_13295 [Victivallales bacterium]|nr:hypothetical protein [Victivallales bacterium]
MIQCNLFTRDYPLPHQHEGTMLGNGYLGLYAWGEGRTLNVSIGCSELWDHRGGMSWTERQNYRDIKAALEAGDEQAIKRIFATDDTQKPGIPSRPSLIPVGRIVFELDGELIRNELDRSTGRLAVIYAKNGVELSGELRLDMTQKGCFAFKCDGVLSYQVLDSYSLSGNALKERSFVPPEILSRDDLKGFVQPMPADKAFSLAVVEADGLYTANFRRSSNVEQLKMDMEGTGVKESMEMNAFAYDALSRMLPGLTPLDWDKLVSDNEAWWKTFWAKVPLVETGSATMDEIYYDGLFKFASMTTPDGYPAGLQGPWLEDNSLPPWSGDYHFNINVEMMYGPAYRANCLDNLRKILDLVWSWREQLRQNARNYIGIDNGYMLPHAVDDHCTCMGAFWTGTIDHACTAWMAQMMVDYADYSGDMDYLRNVAFEFMRGTMAVFLAMLEKRDGTFVLPLSVSPEYRGSAMNAWGENASFQLAAIHRLARNLIATADLLGEKKDPAWQEIVDKLPMAALVKGADGSEEIGLWDGLLLEESHRHHSHLAALCPFDTIDPEDPQWSGIVARSIRRWLYHGMGLWSGWCIPWAAMIQNRLGNAEAAELLLDIWKREYNNCGGGSLHDTYFKGCSLMSSRPQVMQMDGAMGALTAVQDMMLHSRQGILHLFAGSPLRHRNVRFTNMPAPGGFRVSANRTLHEAKVEVVAGRDNTLRLKCHGNGFSHVAINGREAAIDANGLLVLPMKVGETVTLRFF